MQKKNKVGGTFKTPQSMSAGIPFRHHTAPTTSTSKVEQAVCTLRGKTQGKKSPQSC